MNWGRDITKPLVVGIVLLLVVAVSSPLWIRLLPGSHGGRDARKAECSQLLGSARDHCRMAYAKSGSIEEAQKSLAANIDQFQGSYYEVRPVLSQWREGWVRLDAYPAGSSGAIGHMDFKFETGESDFIWDESGGRR
jgi:hypothetical protein